MENYFGFVTRRFQFDSEYRLNRFFKWGGAPTMQLNVETYRMKQEKCAR